MLLSSLWEDGWWAGQFVMLDWHFNPADLFGPMDENVAWWQQWEYREEQNAMVGGLELVIHLAKHTK